MLAPLTWDGLNRLDALFSLRALREHLSILVQCCTNLYHLISAGVKFRVSAKVVTRLKSRKSSYQEKQVRMCFPDAEPDSKCPLTSWGHQLSRLQSGKDLNKI